MQDGETPYSVLPIREDEEGIHFDPNVGILGAIKRAVTLPGDVVTGKVDPMSDEGIERALDIANLATSGSAFGTRPVGALASGASRELPKDPLMVVHALDPTVLPAISRLGGLPSPSLAVMRTNVLPDELSGFGDIHLVGKRHLAEPSETNPVYSGNVYSPIFPDISSGSHSLEHITDVMTKMPTVATEAVMNKGRTDKPVYDYNQMLALMAPRFKSLEDLQASRHLVDLDDMSQFYSKNSSANKQFNYLKELSQPARIPVEGVHPMDAFAQALIDNDIEKHFDVNKLPADFKEKASELAAQMRNLPVSYFEAKPQRAVRFDEFAGALIPQDLEPEYKDILKHKMNLPYVFDETFFKDPSYNPHLKEVRDKMIRKKFGKHLFANGGEVEGSVEFAPEPSLPTFAQPETQAVTKALDVANAAPKYGEFGILPFRTEDEKVVYDPSAGSMTEFVKSAFTPKISPIEIAKGAYEMGKGALESAKSGFTAPYDVLTGKLDPMSDEGIKRALDVAGLAMSGSAFGTRPAGALASGPSRPKPGIGHNMPPEKMKITPKRVTNPIGMYSHAAEVARNLPQQSGTFEQLLGGIKNAPGVSPEEIHWSGIEKAFQPGQKVTAEDVAKHFESNLPQVTETVYGGRKVSKPHQSNPDEWRDYFETNADGWASQYEKDSFEELTPAQQRRVERELKEEFDSDFMDSDYGYVSNPVPGYNKPAKFEWLSQEGGKNYREITLQLNPPQGEFKGSHHDEPNTVGHLRVSDFRGPNNEKILYVHEVQSDWGQVGRKTGFDPDSLPPAPYVSSREGTHNTPGWTDLLIKRIMQEAQRGKYDKVVFENVEQQIKRSGTSSAKGMNAFYGDILPKRVAKVMKHADPNFGMTEHLVGSKDVDPISFSSWSVGKSLKEMDEKIFPDPEDIDPTVSYVHRFENTPEIYTGSDSKSTLLKLKQMGAYDDYVLHEAEKEGIKLPYVNIKAAESGDASQKSFYLTDSNGETISTEHGPMVFPSRAEALAARKTYLADDVMRQMDSGKIDMIRPGFEVSKAVKHVGKNTRAYKQGGEVEAALSIARKVGR